MFHQDGHTKLYSFTPASGDGRLIRYNLGVIMKKAAMGTLEQSFYGCMFSFVLDKCLEVELLSDRISACLTL